MGSPGSAVWAFDYPLIDDIPVATDDLAGLTDGFCWTPQGIDCSSNASIENNGSIIFSGAPKDCTTQKRYSVRTETCGGPSKACREKKRRDQLNERFLELRSILEPENPSKMDKTAILSDAARTVTQLRSEAQRLKDSNESLQEKIKELKAEKWELREEKQRLRAEKENLEVQVKMLSCQPSFMPTTFGQPPAGAKMMMPMMGYPGFPMWQFMPPGDVDTTQDAESCPPVA